MIAFRETLLPGPRGDVRDLSRGLCRGAQRQVPLCYLRNSTRSKFFKTMLALARQLVYLIYLQADMAQLVEHNLAKVGVAGSSPVVRSIACKGPDDHIRPFSSATWPSGKAEACKAFTPSSNLGVASRN